jgi:hypothetical protein
MTRSPTTPWPYRLTDPRPPGSAPGAEELTGLLRLHDAGIPVAATVVVPPEAEERFYRLNNLPRRLLEVFAGVDPADPDEDDLEERAPEATALLARHFLLDELIDAFYDRIADLPARLRIRRPGGAGLEATRGRPALLAVKEVWAADWSFEALVDRLVRDRTFALEARPVLVHAADRPADAAILATVRRVLPEVGSVWAAASGEVTRLELVAVDPAGTRA